MLETVVNEDRVRIQALGKKQMGGGLGLNGKREWKPILESKAVQGLTKLGN